MKNLSILFLLLAVVTLFGAEPKFLLKVKGTEIVLNNDTEERFFVMGLVDNCPRFGRKLSDKYWPDSLDARFENLSSTGANTMRWNAFYFGRDFTWDANGHVSGLVGDGIGNLRDALDKAAQHKIFVQIVLSTAHFQNLGDGATKEHNGVTNQDRIDNIYKMFTTTEGTQAYIDNVLIPMIDTIGFHPALFGFLLSNELHGMTEMPAGSPYGSGWADQLVPEADLQKFFNLVSGELHRRLPGVICGISLTAKRRNQFTSETLIAAGGDADGVLDIYQLQYYPGDHKENESPFDSTLSGIAVAALGGAQTIAKPVIAGEFWADGITEQDKSTPLYTPTEAYERLWNNGYSGGFGWGSWQYETVQWDAWGGDPATLAAIDTGYLALKTNHLVGIDPWDTTVTPVAVNPTKVKPSALQITNTHLMIRGATQSPMTVTLYNAQGQKLFNEAVAGTKAVSLENLGLARGSYLVKLQGVHGVETQRIVVR